MDNKNLSVNFGIRPKRPCGELTGRLIGKSIVRQVKKMNPGISNEIVGETHFGDIVAKVTINPKNYVIEVEPQNLTEEVFKRLEKSFHIGKKLKHKHSKPRHKVDNHYDRTKNKKFNIEI